MIEAPPRHSKSIHVSQLFPAFAFGKDKDTFVIAASYSGDLATDHGRETRNIVASPGYQHVFPETVLASDSTAKGKWNTNGKGTYNAAGVGGSITGKGARSSTTHSRIVRRQIARPYAKQDGSGSEL